MTSSINILHFLFNNLSRLITCNLRANIHRGVISNTCAKYSNVKTSTNLSKWRNKAVGMHIAGCSQQDVVQEFNVHPSTINQLLSCFRVTRQVNGRRRRRRQLKTAVRQDAVLLQSRGATASNLHAKLPMSYIWRLEWGKLTRVQKQVVTGCQYVSERVRRSRVAVHLTQRHRQTHVPGQPPVYTVLNFI
jgi:hypothetical protein